MFKTKIAAQNYARRLRKEFPKVKPVRVRKEKDGYEVYIT